MTRLNVEVDERLVHDVMLRTGMRTPIAAVEIALQRMLDATDPTQPSPMSRDELLAMRGAGLIEPV